MDKAKFSQFCGDFYDESRLRESIGVYKEKAVHNVIKNYLSPNGSCQEIKCGSFVADILFRDRITEIQTGNFNTLKKKLDFFLRDYKVTVVYPVCPKKRLFWISPDSGDVSKPRNVTVSGALWRLFPELYKIRSFLKNENLSFKIIVLSVDEYRLLNGWSRDKKKGAEKYDKIPTDIIDEIDLVKKEDYINLISPLLPEIFTARDFKNIHKLRGKEGWYCLNILEYLGAVEKTGKEKNAFLYKIKK